MPKNTANEHSRLRPQSRSGVKWKLKGHGWLFSQGSWGCKCWKDDAPCSRRVQAQSKPVPKEHRLPGGFDNFSTARLGVQRPLQSFERRTEESVHLQFHTNSNGYHPCTPPAAASKLPASAFTGISFSITAGVQIFPFKFCLRVCSLLRVFRDLAQSISLSFRIFINVYVCVHGRLSGKCPAMECEK